MTGAAVLVTSDAVVALAVPMTAIVAPVEGVPVGDVLVADATGETALTGVDVVVTPAATSVLAPMTVDVPLSAPTTVLDPTTAADREAVATTGPVMTEVSAATIAEMTVVPVVTVTSGTIATPAVSVTPAVIATPEVAVISVVATAETSVAPVMTVSPEVPAISVVIVTPAVAVVIATPAVAVVSREIGGPVGTGVMNVVPGETVTSGRTAEAAMIAGPGVLRGRGLRRAPRSVVPNGWSVNQRSSRTVSNPMLMSHRCLKARTSPSCRCRSVPR